MNSGALLKDLGLLQDSLEIIVEPKILDTPFEPPSNTNITNEPSQNNETQFAAQQIMDIQQRETAFSDELPVLSNNNDDTNLDPPQIADKFHKRMSNKYGMNKYNKYII